MRAGRFGVAIAALVVLAVGVLVGRVEREVGAQEEGEHGLVGAWSVAIEGESTAEGELISSTYAVFFADGTMLTAGRPFLPAAPNAPIAAFANSPGVGSWETSGERGFVGTFFIQRADADGNFLGTTTIYPTGELAEDGMSYTGTSSVVIADAAGEVVATRFDRVVAERVAVEEAPPVPEATP